MVFNTQSSETVISGCTKIVKSEITSKVILLSLLLVVLGLNRTGKNEVEWMEKEKVKHPACTVG